MTLKGVRVNRVHERAGFVNGVGSRLALLQACHGEPSAAELPNAHGEKDQSRLRLRNLSGHCTWSWGVSGVPNISISTFRLELPRPDADFPTQSVARLARTHQRGPPAVSRSRPELAAPRRAQHNRKPFLSRLPSPARVLELRNLTFSIHHHTRVALTQHHSQWLFPLSLTSPSRPTT